LRGSSVFIAVGHPGDPPRDAAVRIVVSNPSTMRRGVSAPGGTLTIVDADGIGSRDACFFHHSDPFHFLKMLTPEQTQRLFEAHAAENRRLADPAYASAMARHPAHARIGDWIRIDQGNRVLELGVGPGRYAALLQALGFDVVGVDPIAFDTWDELRARGRCELISGVRAEALPFANSEFDHVACMGALLYFADPAQALSEIRRVLKPGGRLIIRTQNRRNLYQLSTGRPLEPAAHNFYTRAELDEHVSAAGFEIVNSFTWGFWPPYIHMKWWYFVNLYMPTWALGALSVITPAALRHNIIVFARRPH
jgi:SAM-dependent methyltransferase